MIKTRKCISIRWLVSGFLFTVRLAGYNYNCTELRRFMRHNELWMTKVLRNTVHSEVSTNCLVTFAGNIKRNKFRRIKSSCNSKYE